MYRKPLGENGFRSTAPLLMRDFAATDTRPEMRPEHRTDVLALIWGARRRCGLRSQPVGAQGLSADQGGCFRG
jgi:hypothetical protein